MDYTSKTSLPPQTAYTKKKTRIPTTPKGVGGSSILSTELKGRTSNGSSINRPIDTSDSEQGSEHPCETLAGQKASSDGEHVHVEVRWVPLHPNMIEDGSTSHGDGEERLGENETLDCVMGRLARAPSRLSVGN